LSVDVPASAKVFVNGMATTSAGPMRQYMSRNLQPGSTYTYEVRAEMVRDGKTVSETKTVQLTAGQKVDLAFALTGEANTQLADAAAPQTTLVVRVPADAQVYLAGHETRSSGALRQFTTTQLAPGGEWTNYVVRAAIQRDGQMVTKEQTISLKAGQSHELTFDFDAPAVADKVANASSR
jgi:uncharacterized protein (TIGR03000 family)